MILTAALRTPAEHCLGGLSAPVIVLSVFYALSVTNFASDLSER